MKKFFVLIMALVAIILAGCDSGNEVIVQDVLDPGPNIEEIVITEITIEEIVITPITIR